MLAEFEGFAHVNDDDWGTSHPYLSMRPAEHRVHAALVYLDDYGARAVDGTIDSAHLDGNTPRTRKVLYDHFASRGWKEHLDSRTPLKLCYKLKRWGLAGSEDVVHGWSKQLRTRVPPTVWDFYFRLLFRAVPFEKRLLEAKLKDSRGHDFPNICYFCRDGEDGAHHVYRHCAVVRDIALRCLGTSEALSSGSMLLAEPGTDLKDARSMILLVYAFWRVRQDFLRTMGKPVPATTIARRVEARFRNLAEGKKKKREISDQLSAFLDNPPPEAALYFTDGSATPNPGPSGSGLFRPAGPLPALSASVHLGYGSNNEAELYAIGMALECISESSGVSYSCIFTDSDYAHGILERNHKITVHHELVQDVKNALRKARETATVFIVWIKAHAGHMGNEMADSKAKEGALPTCALVDLDKNRFLFA
jgi:ribonuclease HI